MKKITLFLTSVLLLFLSLAVGVAKGEGDLVLQGKSQTEKRSDKASARATLRVYEKTFRKLDRLGLVEEALLEVRSELACASRILSGIDGSADTPRYDKDYYTFIFIILFRADALATAVKAREVVVLKEGARLLGASGRLEDLAASKRGKRIVRGLVAQEALARDYLAMPEVLFCEEEQYLEEDNYSYDSILSAYFNLVTWEVSEWAVSPSSERAFNMLYRSYYAIENSLPGIKKKRLLRFENMYFSALLPWFKWKRFLPGESRELHLSQRSFLSR